MGKAKNRMSKNKGKWYEPYKIETTLDKIETARRIESKTAFMASRFEGSIDNLLFYGGKKYDGEYRGYISPRKVPPCARQNAFMPKAIIEIIINSEKESIVFVRLKPTFFCWIGFGVFFMAVGSTNVLFYAFIQCLIIFLFSKYWEFVRRRVGKLLEELLEAEKGTEE